MQDTNPIFLFNQQFIDSTDSPVPTTQHGSGHGKYQDVVEWVYNEGAVFSSVSYVPVSYANSYYVVE